MSVKILVGDCRKRLRELPDKSVHTCITSPPYWKLRSYLDDDDPMKQYEIGMEDTLQEYVQHLVEVFREVKRVLRDDGTVWLNLGDAYSKGGGKQVLQTKNASHGLEGLRGETPRMQPKQLLGIPWRVAFALQADGWYLRSPVVWAKGVSFARKTVKCPHCKEKHEVEWAGSSMPESVRDRPSTSYEMAFLLSKSKRYFYDQEAVRERGVAASAKRYQAPFFVGAKEVSGQGRPDNASNTPGRLEYSGTRNLRSVWVINPRGFKEAHFATFPTTLVEPMMKLGTSERGCCGECGGPFERAVSVSYRNPGNRTTNGPRSLAQRHETPGFAVRLEKSPTTLGWRPTCTCYSATPWPFGRKKINPDMLDIAIPLLEEYSRFPTVPCTALDPFGGAGTVGVVATQLGRDAILCELNEEYCEMSRRRIEKTEFVEFVGREDSLVGNEQVLVAEQISMFPVEVS